jgi:hypothetical protein
MSELSGSPENRGCDRQIRTTKVSLGRTFCRVVSPRIGRSTKPSAVAVSSSVETIFHSTVLFWVFGSVVTSRTR